MKLKNIILYITTISLLLFLLSGCSEVGFTRSSNKNEDNKYYSDHVFTGGNLNGIYDIRSVKIQKMLNSERIVIQFNEHALDKKDAYKTKGIPKYEFKVSKNQGILTFKHYISFVDDKPDTENVEWIESFDIVPTYEGEPTSYIINFSNYTEYRLEEDLTNGRLYISIRTV